MTYGGIEWLTKDMACQSQTLNAPRWDMYCGEIYISSMDLVAERCAPIPLEERYASFKRRLAERLAR